MVTGQKSALESLWHDHCAVVVREEKTNPATKITSFVETVLYEDVPCKLSFKTLAPTDGEPVSAVTQSVKLFLSPDIGIPPGSRITVTHNGLVTDYAQSGEPGVFTNHQEVALSLWRGWA